MNSAGVALLTAVLADADRVRIDEIALSREHRHIVAPQLVLDDLLLDADRLGDAPEELFRSRTRAVASPLALVEPALSRGREVENRLAKRLARDRPGVDANPADVMTFLDDGGLLPELGRLNRRALSGRTAADADEIEVVRHGASPPGVGAA
jgi:hypothetical protein